MDVVMKPTHSEVPAMSGDNVIACVGLGLMGGAMAANLLKAGYAVRGFDFDPAALERLEHGGGKAACHPAAAAAGARIALIMVNNAAQVEQVLFGSHGVVGALANGAAIWVASTIPACDMKAFAQRLVAHGLLMVDGPVSGGLTGAQEGTLTVIAGGSKAALAAVQGPMQACSDQIYHVGDVGAGSTVKIVNNLLAASHIVLAAEALAFGMHAGADPDQLIRVITQSSGTSRMFEKRAPRMLAGDHAPHANIETFLKDLDIALDTAQSLRFPTPMADAARQAFKMAADAGQAKASDTTLIQIYERLASIDAAPVSGESLCKHSNKN